MKLSLAIGTAGIALGACASDQVLGWEAALDGGESSTLPEAGTPPTSTAECGNGKKEPGEECDDGNLSNGDGCDALCKTEVVVPSACPGTAFPLTGTGDTRSGTVAGDTSTENATLASDTCGGGNGKDVVYALTSDVPGRAVVRLSATWAAYVAVRKTCTSAASETTCKTVPTGGGQTEVSVPLAANETVFLVVDGVGGQSGPFTLDVSISATFCGDGLAMYPEQCDDGNTNDGDGCSASCKLESGDPGPGVCPGIGLLFAGDPTQPKTISLAGDLRLLANTMACFSGSDTGGYDQAYALTPTIDGSLTAVLHATYPTASLHVRRECFNSQTQMECRTELSPTTPARLNFAVRANQTYSLFVDSKSSGKTGVPSGGLYTLELTLAPGTCGNGVLEAPEECDDGNLTAGDGCSPTCTLEPMPDGIDTCEGALVPFQGDPVTGPLTYRTTASTARLTAAARSCVSTSSSRKDASFRIVSPFDGYATIRAKGDFNLGLGLRTKCLEESEAYPSASNAPGFADNVACGSANANDDEEKITVPVEANRPYYLVVEGAQQNFDIEGVFTLDVLIEKSVCGNGRIEGGEPCDDGNNVDGDACGSTCVIEERGTPSRNTCAEAEDLPLVLDATSGAYKGHVTGGNWNLTHDAVTGSPCGASAGRDAFFRVVPEIDGVIVVNVEGTYNLSVALRDVCPWPTSSGFLACSNRTESPGGERIAYAVKKDQPYWIIVDAPNMNTRGAFTVDVSVKAEDCGDTIVGGAEQCDDGNLVAGDGCSPTCTLEPLAGVDTCPGYPVAVGTTQKTVSLSTAGLASNYAGSCGGNGRDGVIAVTSEITGTLSAQLEAVWPAVFYARETCTNGGSQPTTTTASCNAFNPSSPSRTLRDLSVPVIAGVPVYLFVDGIGTASGPGTINLSVTP